MIDYLYIIFFVPIIFFINSILLKNFFLLNDTGKNHQKYTNLNQVPLSGGLLIMIFFFYFIPIFDLLVLISTLFILGLLADLNLVNSPLKRFIFQIVLIVIFVIYLEIEILDLRIEILNTILKNNFFNLFFCSMCFLVLINGSNFIDGNNGLSIGYFLITFLFISKFSNLDYFNFDNLNLFIFFLFILLVFNLFNKLYLGDSGIYILSIFSGYILINIYNNNDNISPYYIVNLLWYPAFEILFSMIRKINLKFSPIEPDTLHLHQLVFFYLTKKLKNRKNITNSITGLSINLYIVISLTSASNYLDNSKVQALFLLMNMMIYLIFYLIFYRYKLLFEKKFDH